MIESWLKRFGALFDKSAWMLIAPAAALLFWIDPPSAKTLLQWSLFAVVIAGVSVIVSRIIFPQIDLTGFIRRARDGSLSNAVVAAAVIVFVGIALMAIVLWAKP